MKHRRCPHAHGGHGWGGHAHHGHAHRAHHPVHRHHRKTLHRRIFLWFGATIVVTALIVATLFSLLSPGERFRRDRAGLERFVSARVEAIWDDPAQREALVRDLQVDLHLDATLYDASGVVLARRGSCVEPWGQFPLARADGRRLGRLEVCGEPYHFGGWRFAVVLLVALAVLWAASGMFARRLLRPLRHLEQLAKHLGDGDLSVRSNLDPQRHGELGMLGRTMDEMAARIERQLADQRELLAAVSHELRTPLGHLRLLLEMARERPGETLTDEIEREVLEIDALVGQLLASSRLDFGALNTKSVDAVALAERALERAELDVSILAVEGKATRLEADPTLVARALANLLTNANHHGGGVTGLTLRFEPDEVVFAVEDRGPGFVTDEREKVFGAFYRGERRAGASLGLGLSLVHRIASAHGGRAWIEDVEGGGARVLFSVAAVKAEG